MAGTMRSERFARAYLAYSYMLEALGFEVDEGKVLERVTGDSRVRDDLKRILRAHREGNLDGGTVKARLVRQMEALRTDLTGKLREQSPQMAAGAIHGADLIELVGEMQEMEKDALADVVALDGHRGMVKPRTITVREFQAILAAFAGDQTVARQKLLAHLRDELLRRGIDMSRETIEERFRSKPVVRTMPYCVKHIFRGLGGEFRTGLIPIRQLVGEEDPDRWLEDVRRRLRFRSQCAMHRAIAVATGVTYECIHKALSGRKKAKRIQVEIKRCLEGWLAKAEAGEHIGVDEGYLSVPVQEMCALMPRLQPVFGTKEAVYRRIAAKTSLRAGSIRRYFQNDGQLKHAPLRVYRVAVALAGEAAKHLPEASEAQPARRRSARSPGARRRASRTSNAPRSPRVDPGAAVPRAQGPEGSVDVTGQIARDAEQALARWRRQRGDEELEQEFKGLRRMLIVKLRQRRTGKVAQA